MISIQRQSNERGGPRLSGVHFGGCLGIQSLQALLQRIGAIALADRIWKSLAAHKPVDPHHCCYQSMKRVLYGVASSLRAFCGIQLVIFRNLPRCAERGIGERGGVGLEALAPELLRNRSREFKIRMLLAGCPKEEIRVDLLPCFRKSFINKVPSWGHSSNFLANAAVELPPPGSSAGKQDSPGG